MASKNSDSCPSSGTASTEVNSDNSLKQSTPFNFSNFGVLVVFCIILSLSSSTYHNWPAIERSLVNDKVFQHLCTENEIRESIPEMYVCDKQRDAIGNLSLNIFLFEFIAYSIGGPLVDIVGVYFVMIAGFAFGFYGFILLYFYHDTSFIVKFSFCCWGMFGGLIIITSIHFARMFPNSESLADGMMIFFENFASIIPLAIYKLIKRFGITYYEGYGSYIIWGIVPSFLLALAFIPIKVISKENTKSNCYDKIFEFNFNGLSKTLGCWELWANLVVFSIPVTSAMFYRKTFSAYFLNNPNLQRIFPLILLFVFLPIPFISALDQFLSVYLTSAFLYILYILAFLCFFYRTETHGLISMVLFCIAHSAEHQIMHYISKTHKENESTLMGISYSVVFVVGFISQFVFDFIYKVSPKLALYTIISLLFVATIFSVAFEIAKGSEKCNGNGKSEKSSELNPSKLRIVYVILWFVPFIFLCIVLSFKSFMKNKNGETKWKYCICKMPYYCYQKLVTTTMVFYSFSFYYVCTVFTVIATIFKFCKLVSFEYDRHRFIWLLICLGSFFLVSHFITGFQFYYMKQNHEPILKLLIVLFICKIILFVYSMMKPNKTVIYLFSGFLILYGYTFFMFIHMLTYYNFQITYVERSYLVSLIHWGRMFTLFLLLRFFYIKVSNYSLGYYSLWAFNIGYFTFFAIQLIYYFSYEMDLTFRFSTCNLPIPKFKSSCINEIESKPFCARLFSVILVISNLAILISFVFCWTLIVVLIWCFFNDFINAILSISFRKELKEQYKEQHPKMIDEFILPISSVSLALFVALFICRILMSDYKFNNDPYVYVLIICSFAVLSYYSNVSWFHTQYDLQTCCCKTGDSCECKNNGSCCCCCTKKCLCCICRKCCCCKQPNAKCNCPCSKPPSDQCCCKTPGSCNCCNSTCQCCSSNSDCCKCCKNCEKCVCMCLKTISLGARKLITFEFFECEFKDVVNNFVSFFIGNTFGWLLFIAYFAFSKEQNVFLSFR
uniref:Integral membrane protein, putative n=1 Tax=Theileria annulata TaxID=5874 RepID=A0A3B0MXJ9_THEAN